MDFKEQIEIFEKLEFLASQAVEGFITGLMFGAIFFHLTTDLGIVVHWDGQNDGGVLFGMGVAATLISIYLLIKFYKNNLPINSIQKIFGLNE